MGMGPTRGLEPEQELVFNWKQLRGGPASDLGVAYSGKRKPIWRRVTRMLRRKE